MVFLALYSTECQHQQKLTIFLVSVDLQRHIIQLIPCTSVDVAMSALAGPPPARERNLFCCKPEIDFDTYLPPKDLFAGEVSAVEPNTVQNDYSFSNLKIFLQRFLFLSTNNLLSQVQFHQVFQWIFEKDGVDILAVITRGLRSPLMAVFARELFRSAIMSENVPLGRKVFKCGFRPRTLDLSIAFHCGNEAMVELICEAGVRPEVDAFSNFHILSWELYITTLHTLLAHGADPESFIIDRETGFPLIDAALRGSLNVVQLLLSRGARANLYLAQYYGTALQAAVFGGHLEVAEYLIQKGADINVPSVQQIHFQHSCNEDLVIPLLTPVQIAAMMDNVSLLQFLLQHGASALACPASAHPDFLHYHCRRVGSPASNIRQYEPQRNSRGLVYTALQYAAINQNLATMNLLLDIGAPPDSRVAPFLDDTPLQMATRLGNVEMYQLLWFWNADINASPAICNGRTAIQGAAESGSLEILLMLLEAGAQINAAAGSDKGMTAMQAACLNGHSLIVGILYAKGADLTVGPSPVGGLTPIQAAAFCGDIGLVRYLIDLGEDVNAPATEGGMTALLAAIKHRCLPLLELLVAAGRTSLPFTDETNDHYLYISYVLHLDKNNQHLLCLRDYVSVSSTFD